MLSKFWAPQQFCFYKAEEIDRFFHSWDDVLDYWRGNDRLHAEVSLSFHDVNEVELAGDHHFLTAAMEWRIRFRDDATDSNGAPFRHQGAALAGFNHVLSLWTGPPDDARLTGWCEAPEAAPLYIAKLYRRIAERA